MSISNHSLSNHGVSLNRGACLRFALHDDHGMLLLAKGAEITERVQNLLQVRGIHLNVFATLKVTAGPALNEEIPVRSRTTIGRRPTCDIELVSEIVTGVHCAIEKRAFGVYLEDLGSRNGTFLNDVAIRGRVALSDQDAIRVGDTVFTIQIYAALSSDSEEGRLALKAWTLAEPGKNRTATSPYAPTMPDIDLGE